MQRRHRCHRRRHARVGANTSVADQRPIAVVAAARSHVEGFENSVGDCVEARTAPIVFDAMHRLILMGLDQK